MKPFNGGMWVGVSRITNGEELRFAYDHSGERLMHLQASVEDFDVFTRSLSIGPQTKVMRYDPGAHGHYRYAVDGAFVAPELEREVASISRLVNAFFRWEFNSCEVIVKDGEAHPIDYANASPDIALVSLHYHFAWAIKSLVAWCGFCALTGRRMRVNQNTRDYFEIGDRDDLSYAEKLAAYRRLSDEHFETERYRDFCASRLPHVDELVLEWVASADFDGLLVDTVRSLYPEHEHEQFIGHFRGLIGQWVREHGAAPERSMS